MTPCTAACRHGGNVGCPHCQAGIPHHTNAVDSIGGPNGRHYIWDLHHMPAGDLAECHVPAQATEIRLATDTDRDFVLTIKNDPVAVKYSTTKQPVTELEHLEWWGTTKDMRWILEGPVGKMGYLRIAPSGVISICVSPEHRGKRYGNLLVRYATTFGRGMGHYRLTAFVDLENIPSWKAFRREGYRAVAITALHEELRLEKGLR